MKQKSKRPKTKARKTIKKKTVSKVKTKAKNKPKPRPVSRPKPKQKSKPKVVVLKESIISAKKPTDIQLLEQFFGGPAKMKLWKIFSLNSTREFTLKDLVKLTKTKSDTLIVDLREFMKKGVIQATRKQVLLKGDAKAKQIVYSLAHDFPLLSEITQMILTAIPRSSEKVLAQLQPLQKLRTVLLAGFFTSKLGISTSTYASAQSNIDLLLVFEKVPSNVAEVIADLEHNLGRELRYAAFDQEDFKYRHSIGDKLVRDVLDFDHKVIMDKMGFFR